tara:strand:- start:9604 stop:9834 length:231 start_codon:yes stop_codon:yes gene_type:complete
MNEADNRECNFPWHAAGALFFCQAALIGFVFGVSVTERDGIVSAGLLTQAYYSLSLLVMGSVACIKRLPRGFGACA